MPDLPPDREVEMAVRTWIRNSGVPHTERMRRALESARWETQEIARPLQARIEELSTMLRGMARRSVMLRVYWHGARHMGRVAHATVNARADALQARVEVLTAALTDVVTHLHPPSSDTWARGVLDRASAALNAVVVCRFCGQPEGDTVWCCDALMEADGAT